MKAILITEIIYILHFLVIIYTSLYHQILENDTQYVQMHIKVARYICK